jgi:AraC-like DNA-binding protein
MEAEPLSRFKIFESNDADESVEALDRFFGGQHSIRKLSPAANRTSISAGNVANSLLVHFRSTHEILVWREDTRDSVTIIIPLSGHMYITSGTRDEITASREFGVVLPMEEATKAVLSEYDGLGFMIDRRTIQKGLEALVGKAATVDFDLVLDPAANGGKLICDSIKMAATQLEQAETPLGQQAIAARLEEFIVNALLLGQPHNYLDVIAGERRAATPKQVRRAEEYIRAHAGEAITLSQIAEAAACSVRALQLAFRTFRDTTPMALHRRARLDRIRAELSVSDPGATTVTEVAVKYGFYNLGRFARDYRATFGQSPSETLRFKPERVPVMLDSRERSRWIE